MTVPRIIVSVTLFLWLLLFLFGVVEKDSQVALYPFIGCYPGPLSEPGYHPVLLDIWQASLMIILAALAAFGFYRNSRPAALACLGFSLLFSAAGFVRIYFFAIPQISPH